MNLNILFAFLICVLYVCNGYRILAIFPFHGRSHMVVLQEIAKALARKGHQVDVISHFPLKQPETNYNDIIQLKNTEKYASIDYKTIVSMDEEDKWINRILRNICDYLGHPEVQKLIKDQQKLRTYDLLLVHYLSGYQCFPAIGYLLDIPVVGIVTTALYPWMHGFVGNPLNLWLYPSNLRPWKNENLTFWGRLYNVVITHRDIIGHYKYAEQQQPFIECYLGKGLPSYRELEKRTALILSNSHYSYHGIKSKTPAVVEIGGIHISNDTVPIDLNLEKFLDESKDGFIYFSFGSMAVTETIPREFFEKFYAAFRKIAPVRVIMRASNPQAMPKPLPENTFIYSWLPQQQILRHPNIKGFITHGGSLGTQEALYYAVPMICASLFAEQHLNCDILAKKNVVLRLKFQTAEQSKYENALREILFNPIYKQAVIKYSKLYRDRPHSPADEVVYWVEYVIRHGSNVLRSPAVDIHWWQIELIDVYAFLLACFLLALGIVIIVVRKLLILFLYTKISDSKKVSPKVLKKVD